MKGLLLIAICLVLLAAGCIEQKDAEGKNTMKVAGGGMEMPSVTITSPRAGEILQGNNDVSFDAIVKGGKKPYAYRWSSNIDGGLATRSFFRQNPSKLSKGHHLIILAVTDASGSSGQGSVSIEVM
jgi:hypothetical protein